MIYTITTADIRENTLVCARVSAGVRRRGKGVIGWGGGGDWVWYKALLIGLIRETHVAAATTSDAGQGPTSFFHFHLFPPLPLSSLPMSYSLPPSLPLFPPPPLSLPLFTPPRPPAPPLPLSAIPLGHPFPQGDRRGSARGNGGRGGGGSAE